MSLVAFYGLVFADVGNQQSQRGIIGATSPNQAAMPARAEWKEYGTIAGWIKQLELYKRDTKFKWSKLKHLKLDGFKLRIAQKALTPELYTASIKLFTMVDFTGTANIPPKVWNEAVKMLVCFLKHLAKLVKDFRSFYDPAKCPTKQMDYLAILNPKMFTILQAGSDQNGFSVTIVIENLLTCTEINKNGEVAKLAAASKVCEYLLQLSNIIEIIPKKKDNGELEPQPATQKNKSARERFYEELVKVLSNRKALNPALA